MMEFDKFGTSGNDTDMEEAFENWVIETGFAEFAATQDAPAQAVLTSPRHTTGITLTGAD